MAFPQTANPTVSVLAAGTNHNVNMPPVVNAGDFLIALIVVDDDNETINTPSGWSRPGIGTQAGGQSVTMGVFTKVAAGTEGGGTVNFTTGSSEPMAAQVYRVVPVAGFGTLASIACSTAVDHDSGENFDPPNLTHGFGAGDHLAIAALGKNEDDGIDSYSADYTGGTLTSSGATLSDVSVASCRKEVTGASENPGAINIAGGGAAGWAFTIVVQGDPDNEAPSIDAGPTVDYGSFTRTGANNTPWGLAFTASDPEQTGADELDWEVRTASGGGGTLVASGTATSGVPVATTIAYNASGLVNGNQTLYLRVSDGITPSEQSFTLKRDDDVPAASTSIEVTAV